MKTFEERFTAWVDGQLTGPDLAECEKELATHPEAAAERAEAQKLGDLLRAQHAPKLGNADFFNHQLMQRIAAETPRAAEPVRARLVLVAAAAGLRRCRVPRRRGRTF